MPIQLYALVAMICILIIFVYILTVLFTLIFHRIRIEQVIKYVQPINVDNKVVLCLMKISL